MKKKTNPLLVPTFVTLLPSTNHLGPIASGSLPIPSLALTSEKPCSDDEELATHLFSNEHTSLGNE
jgi:hypothetical protein